MIDRMMIRMREEIYGPDPSFEPVQMADPEGNEFCVV
jgi:hypothetical protein